MLRLFPTSLLNAKDLPAAARRRVSRTSTPRLLLMERHCCAKRSTAYFYSNKKLSAFHQTCSTTRSLGKTCTRGRLWVNRQTPVQLHHLLGLGCGCTPLPSHEHEVSWCGVPDTTRCLMMYPWEHFYNFILTKRGHSNSTNTNYERTVDSVLKIFLNISSHSTLEQIQEWR